MSARGMDYQDAIGPFINYGTFYADASQLVRSLALCKEVQEMLLLY